MNLFFTFLLQIISLFKIYAYFYTLIDYKRGFRGFYGLFSEL